MKVASRIRPPGSAEKLRLMLDPASYPDATRVVASIETHFAWVFLTNRHAYKMKKPMRQAAMDYRTLRQRERGCRAEVRLNRRLAPSVYLGVVPLMRRAGGALAIGGRGEVVEWLVRMVRLPHARMLDRALANGRIGTRDIDALVALLASFFATRARPRPLRPATYLRRLRERAVDNARALRSRDLGIARARVDALLRAQLAFIALHGTLIAGRAAHVRDGHGDLRPEHVCLGPTPCVIDCLEFDAELRRLDPAEELAFLALECARLGHAQLGMRLISRYREALGDPVSPAVVHFYMSQRAAGRAMTSAWHVRDKQFARRPWIERANSYLEDGLVHARTALRLALPQRGSVLLGERPLAQQRRKRLARQHAPERHAQQQRNGQQRQLAGLL